METQMKQTKIIDYLIILQIHLHYQRIDMNIEKQQPQKTIIISRL